MFNPLPGIPVPGQSCSQNPEACGYFGRTERVRACFPGYLSDCQAAHDFFRPQCFKWREVPSNVKYTSFISHELYSRNLVIFVKGPICNFDETYVFFHLFNGMCCLFCQVFSALLLSRGANQRQRLGFESIAGYLGVLGKRPAEHKLVPNRLTLIFARPGNRQATDWWTETWYNLFV